MIKIHDLEKKLSPDFTLRIGELSIADGERVAVIGPNGSGKSTLLKLLSGTLKPDRGSIESSFPAGKTGYSPQYPYVFRGSVQYNVKLGAKNKDIGGIIDACRLTDLKNKKASELSGGEKQRMCLARMLAGEYDCLLLDEPLSAVDIDMGSELEALLSDTCEKRGATLLIATHIPSEALRVSTKILIMNGGKVEEYTDTASLSSPQSEFGKKFISLWRV